MGSSFGSKLRAIANRRHDSTLTDVPVVKHIVRVDDEIKARIDTRPLSENILAQEAEKGNYTALIMSTHPEIYKKDEWNNGCEVYHQVLSKLGYQYHGVALAVQDATFGEETSGCHIRAAW